MNAPGEDTPMDFDTCFDRIAMWAMAYAAELEEDGATGIIDGINRDLAFIQHELDWSAAMSDVVASGGLPRDGEDPVCTDCGAQAFAIKLSVVARAGGRSREPRLYPQSLQGRCHASRTEQSATCAVRIDKKTIDYAQGCVDWLFDRAEKLEDEGHRNGSEGTRAWAEAVQALIDNAKETP